MEPDKLAFLKKCEQINYKVHAKLIKQTEQDIERLKNALRELNRCVKAASLFKNQTEPDDMSDYNLEQFIKKLQTLDDAQPNVWAILLEDFQDFRKVRERVRAMAKRLSLEQ